VHGVRVIVPVLAGQLSAGSNRTPPPSPSFMFIYFIAYYLFIYNKKYAYIGLKRSLNSYSCSASR